MKLITLHCTGMGTPLSCDYVVSSFPGIFTPQITLNFDRCLRNPLTTTGVHAQMKRYQINLCYVWLNILRVIITRLMLFFSNSHMGELYRNFDVVTNAHKTTNIHKIFEL